MAEKTRIAVLVSGGGTNLQALIDAQDSGILHSGEIVAVISNKPGVYALTRAENAGIGAYVANKKELGENFEAELIRIIEEVKADIIILAGFMCILSEDFTSRFPNRMINVHPALIPSFCGKGYYGLRVHEAALEKGVKVTGATVHFVNEVCDGGEIIAQKAVEVKDDDTPETLQKRVMEEAEWIILPLAAEKVSARIMKQKGE